MILYQFLGLIIVLGVCRQLLSGVAIYPALQNHQTKRRPFVPPVLFSILIYFVEPPYKTDYSQNFGVNTQQNHHAEYFSAVTVALLDRLLISVSTARPITEPT